MDSRANRADTGRRAGRSGMYRIAMLSLVHDRGKLVAAVAGVAFAAMLVLVQGGMYSGFLDSASAPIRNMGGDVWVMAKGTEVIDEGEPLSAGTRGTAARHPCVKQVRGVIMGWAWARKENGAPSTVQIVAAEEGSLIPWSMISGLPSDVGGPMRVAVDAGELSKLHIHGDPIGLAMDVSGYRVHIAALTRGIRSFTLMPYLFTSVRTARRVTGMGEGRFTFLALDLAHPSCTGDVIAAINAEPDLEAMTTAEFRQKSEDYWVGGSGAGTALAFGALLGLIVGTAIVGQTLYAVTKEHAKELATLKALGASRRHLLGFVAWQAVFLCLAGQVLGLAMAFSVRGIVTGMGVKVILSQSVVASGAAAIAGMCIVASVSSVLRVLKLEVAEVFQ